MTAKAKTYVVNIFISEPTPEHAKIKDIANRLSNGEYEFVHLHRMGVVLVLNTDRDAGAICKAIQEACAADDRIFISALGLDWQTYGLNKAAFWLRNHLKNPAPPVRTASPSGDDE